MERIRLRPALTLPLTLFGAAIVSKKLEGRTPLLELDLPVQHHTGRDNNQVWPPHAPVMHRSSLSAAEGAESDYENTAEGVVQHLDRVAWVQSGSALLAGQVR